MDADNSGLWWALVIVDGAVGAGMFVYGIRQKAPLPLACGIALNIVPMLSGTGTGLLAITALVGVGYYLARKFI